MSDGKTKRLKLKYLGSQNKDFKIAWNYLNWKWRIIFILGCTTLLYFLFKLGQWLFG